MGNGGDQESSGFQTGGKPAQEFPRRIEMFYDSERPANIIAGIELTTESQKILLIDATRNRKSPQPLLGQPATVGGIVNAVHIISKPDYKWKQNESPQPNSRYRRRSVEETGGTVVKLGINQPFPYHRLHRIMTIVEIGSPVPVSFSQSSCDVSGTVGIVSSSVPCRSRSSRHGPVQYSCRNHSDTSGYRCFH
jgi:hypothetical protein